MIGHATHGRISFFDVRERSGRDTGDNGLRRTARFLIQRIGPPAADMSQRAGHKKS
jgi:hypothetical protein